jgi:predicted TIM-barrel enzyme
VQIQFVQQVPESIGAVPSGSLVIVCPWLKGLPEESGLWIAALPIHDVNGYLDDDPGVTVPTELHGQLYFGVFALDRFRSLPRLFASLHAKGIERIVNLPSVSFFDGRSAGILQSLDLGCAQEVEFLRKAKSAGFRVALCARRTSVATLGDLRDFDFALYHEGPRSSFSAETVP